MITPELQITWRDPVTGDPHPSRAAMRRAVKSRNATFLANFEQSVREQTLGQDPWVKLPMETPLQYERFKIYRDMVPKERTMLKVANITGVCERNITDMASNGYWRLRAECWDREVDRQAELQFLEAKRVSARKQAALGQKLQLAASRGADVLLTGVVEMSAGEVARLADTGVKIERLAMDKATSHEAQVTRFIYEGAKPKWADHSQVVEEVTQSEAGPLEQRVRDEANSQPRPEEER